MNVRYQKVIHFLKKCSGKDYRRLISFYNQSGSNPDSYWDLFGLIVPVLVQIGKVLSKVMPKRTRNKKARHCIHVCFCIMLDNIFRFKRILEKNRDVCFEKMVQRLYAFDPQMALLLTDIVLEVLHDPRLKDFVPLSGRALMWRFFGKNTLMTSNFPSNIPFYPFYLKDVTFFQVIFFLGLVPRKRLLTTFGWIRLLIHKLRIRMFFQKEQMSFFLRKLLFLKKHLQIVVSV